MDYMKKMALHIMETCDKMLFKDTSEREYRWYNFAIQDVQTKIKEMLSIGEVKETAQKKRNKEVIKILNDILSGKLALWDIFYGSPLKRKISNIKIYYHNDGDINFKIKCKYCPYDIMDWDIGKTVFFSKQIANRQLKVMRDKNYIQ